MRMAVDHLQSSCPAEHVWAVLTGVWAVLTGVWAVLTGVWAGTSTRHQQNEITARFKTKTK